MLVNSCFIYHKGTDFQANHNRTTNPKQRKTVVLYTTKVLIFKQITTPSSGCSFNRLLFYIPQRYWFSSKSQPVCLTFFNSTSCFIYHKGTDFQANHNRHGSRHDLWIVVLYTTKVLIFKQITTKMFRSRTNIMLFYIPQRYWFSSKSQRTHHRMMCTQGCFIYHKGTDFQANHNCNLHRLLNFMLFYIPQRYWFSSKSQPH